MTAARIRKASTAPASTASTKPAGKAPQKALCPLCRIPSCIGPERCVARPSDGPREPRKATRLKNLDTWEPLLVAAQSHLVGDPVVDALYAHTLELQNALDESHASEDAVNAITEERDERSTRVDALYKEIRKAYRALGDVQDKIGDALYTLASDLDDVEGASDETRKTLESRLEVAKASLASIDDVVMTLTNAVED